MEQLNLIPIESKAVTAVELQDAMAEMGISGQDLIIPKLLLMQGTSEYVGDDKAKLGDIVNSQTLEVVGSFTTSMQIIPLKMYKTWRIYDMSEGQPNFIRQVPVTAANEKLAWEDIEEGKPIRRDMCMNFFVLLDKELKANEAFPCVISFKRTSMQAGKQLATHLFKMAALGRPPYVQSLILSTAKRKTETNSYAIFEIGKGTELDSDAKGVAKEWISRLASMVYTIDEEIEKADTKSSTQAEAPIVVGDAPDMKF
jgi:hypothetical protein